MRKLILALMFCLIPAFCSAATHMLFIADQNTATIDGVEYTFFELNVGATKYRIGKAVVPEPYATQYKYYRMDGVSLAKEGATHLLDVQMPDQYVNVAKQANEFRAWSYTDLAARIATGQLPAVILKKFLKVRYTVTPVDGEDSGQRTGTLEEYEDDASSGKTWGRAFIPMKWFGKDFEHND